MLEDAEEGEVRKFGGAVGEGPAGQVNELAYLMDKVSLTKS